MRPRTITVDVTRGGDYALADYHQQARTHRARSRLIRSMVLVGAVVRAFGQTAAEAAKAMRRFDVGLAVVRTDPEVRAIFRENGGGDET